MKKLATLLSLAVVLGAGSASAAGVKIGTLTCTANEVTNAIIYTSETFSCVFAPLNGQNEDYTGQIQKLGVDLMLKGGETMVWAVFAANATDYEENALAGTYVGAGAAAAVGVGAGAKVLVGGGADSFTLQPISVSGLQGVGASLNIESFSLSPA